MQQDRHDEDDPTAMLLGDSADADRPSGSGEGDHSNESSDSIGEGQSADRPDGSDVDRVRDDEDPQSGYASSDGAEDGRGYEDEDAPEDESGSRKKKPALIAAAAVMALVTLGLGGFFANLLLGKFMPSSATAAQTAPDVPLAVLDRPQQPQQEQVQVAQTPAPAEQAASAAPSGAGASGLAGPVGASPPLAQSAAMMGAAAAAATVTPIVANGQDTKLAALQSRLDNLEQENAQLKKMVQKSAVESKTAEAKSSKREAIAGNLSAPAPSGRPGQASRKESAAQQKNKPALAASKKVSPGGKPGTTETVESPPVAQANSAPRVEFGDMRLRAVYPPTGDDRRAWIAAGERVYTVTEGSMIRGVRVLRVESTRVVMENKAEIR